MLTRASNDESRSTAVTSKPFQTRSNSMQQLKKPAQDSKQEVMERLLQKIKQLQAPQIEKLFRVIDNLEKTGAPAIPQTSELPDTKPVFKPKLKKQTEPELVLS